MGCATQNYQIISIITTGISPSLKYCTLVYMCRYEMNAVKSSQNRIQLQIMAVRKEVHIKQWYVLYIYSDHSLKCH